MILLLLVISSLFLNCIHSEKFNGTNAYITETVELLNSHTQIDGNCTVSNFVLSQCSYGITEKRSCIFETVLLKTHNANTLFIQIRMETRGCVGCSTLEISASDKSERKFSVISQNESSGNTDEFFQSNLLYQIDGIQEYQDGIKISMYFSSMFCGTIQSVQVYYQTCSSTKSSNLVTFKNEPAPSKAEQAKKIYGTCLDYADFIPNNRPYGLCWYNGTYVTYGECFCKSGFELIQGKCRACRETHFKTKLGNSNCVKCGDHSRKRNNEVCVCDEGFFRINGKGGQPQAPCYAPPSEPRNISYFAMSDEIQLRWSEPSTGAESKGYYVVSCHQCPSESTFPNLKVNNTKVNIKGLQSYTEYNISIVKINNITKLTKKTFPAYKTIHTRVGEPGQIQQLKFIVGDDGTVTLTWKPPLIMGGPVSLYRIEYGDVSIVVESTSYKIKPEAETITHKVKISAVTVEGKKRYFSPAVTIGVTVNGKGGISTKVIIGGVSGAAALLLIIFVLLIAFWKRRNPNHLQVYRMEDGTVQQKRGRLFSGGRLYVDPTTYSAVDEAVYEFTNELTHKNLIIGNLIGNGEFADVFKGTLTKNGVDISVAVKMLKSNASKKDRDDFVSEAAILGQFSDANVVCLEGVILKDYPNVLVLEYMANGSLDKYLQNNDGQLSVMTLLGMARGVASGMKYLSELGYIHRDLAARNILVDKQDVCKIADFGMSRELKTDETYDTRGGKIPIKWTAPEAIEFKKFTTASDVWSFGILLWEIMSFGTRPYWNWVNYEVLERLATGYRLPPPMDCPKVVHDLMLSCWHKDRTKRPRFSNIRNSIEEWIRYPDLLKDIASVITKSDENLDYSTMETISNWLESIKMEQYVDNFIEKGFMTPKDILLLSIEDLEDLDIGPIGHRKKILKAIKKTKQQIDGPRKVSRSSSSVGNMLARTTSSAGFGTALSKKLSFHGKSVGYEKSTLNNKNTLTKKTSLVGCV